MVGRMKIQTWGLWASYTTQLGAGAAAVAWPDKPWIAEITFYFSLSLFLGITIWFLVSKIRTRSRGQKRSFELVGTVASICFVVTGIFVGWVIHSADARYGVALRLASAARLDFAETEWRKTDSGVWEATTVVHVSGKFMRTGVVIGIGAEGIDNVGTAIMNRQNHMPERYNDAEHLGNYRLYIAEPRAIYVIRFTTTKPQVTFRYFFEGEGEGPSVTRKKPES